MSAVALPEKGFYRHYKHHPDGPPHNYTYEVTGIARNTEDESFLMLYRPLYASNWFAPADTQARPLEMFLGTVRKEGYEMPRFERIVKPELVKKLESVRDEMYGK